MGFLIPCVLAAVIAAQPYDFEPYYLTDDGFREVYEAFKTRKWRKASRRMREILETATDSDSASRIRYVLVLTINKRLLKARGDKKIELKAWRLSLLNQLETFAPLTGAVQYQMGEHYRSAGDGPSALLHYDKVPPGGYFRLESLMASAALAIEMGKGKRALALLDEAAAAGATRWDKDKISLQRGRALALAGQKKAARKLFRDVWHDRWPKRVSDIAAKELEKLGAAPDATDQLLMTFASIRRGKPKKLKKKLKKLLRKMKKAARSAREFAEAVAEMTDSERSVVAHRLFDRAIKGKSAFVRGWARYRKAWLYDKLGQLDKALAQWQVLAEKQPKHPMAPRALAKAADAARRLGNEELALSLVGQLVKRYPEHPDGARFRWEMAWEHWRGKRYAKAGPMFDAIAKELGAEVHLGQATWRERGLYWRGRCEQELGETGRAAGTFSYLVKHYPLTYYSHQSYNRLYELDEAQAKGLRPHRKLANWDKTALVDLSTLEVERSPGLDLAVELTRLGLYDDARAELKVHARLGKLSPAGMTLLASLSLRANKYGDLHRLIRWRGALPRYPDEADQRLWKLAYPLPYWETVKANAKEWKVSPYLILALIRHESAYNPAAVSRAGATGLMQLMPGTAAMVAKNLLKQPRPRKKHLKTSKVNIQLGSRLLKELMSLFHSNEALVLAAYNAGSGRARGWYRQALEQKRLRTDELVEEIPYDETHGYVKSVLASYGVYRYLYGDRDNPANRSIPLERDIPQELGPYF